MAPKRSRSGKGGLAGRVKDLYSGGKTVQVVVVDSSQHAAPSRFFITGEGISQYIEFGERRDVLAGRTGITLIAGKGLRISGEHIPYLRAPSVPEADNVKGIVVHHLLDEAIDLAFVNDLAIGTVILLVILAIGQAHGNAQHKVPADLVYVFADLVERVFTVLLIDDHQDPVIPDGIQDDQREEEQAVKPLHGVSGSG